MASRYPTIGKVFVAARVDFAVLVFAPLTEVFKLNPEELDLGGMKLCHAHILLVGQQSLENSRGQTEQILMPS